MDNPADDVSVKEGPASGLDNEDDGPQCRICLDNDEEMGRLLTCIIRLYLRLIKPCMCKGSISYVHVKCLKRWRESSQSAFFSCPQCHYRYNFQRTKVLGIATNPVVIGVVTSVFFATIVLAASFVTTTFTSLLSPDNYDGDVYFYSPYFVNPYSAFIDLVRAALRVLQDGAGGFDLDLDELLSRTSSTAHERVVQHSPPGFLRRFIRRFLLGLPIVGAGSLVQMLFTVGLGPVQWLARYRGGNRRNRRNNNGTDTATVLLVTLLLIGALRCVGLASPTSSFYFQHALNFLCRAIYQVYQWTERWTKRLLLRAEDIILEVN
ncbi:hypothetical protein K488DRAFT_77912 [Vararia minispora EC-137]|uniref:Uncharacterized protein n=1 Tax=Vararia minispora EC-137 TaxID=1314806 RepID=A0ACB8QPE5_9AGAM|nr:hypothetical protein K488DRAFT_77912 [Vararia minispora EC-137]